MTYQSSPFSDSDYSLSTWVSADIDISTLNPDNDPDIEYQLNWDETYAKNEDYAEVRVDILDSSGNVLIGDIKKYADGSNASFYVSTNTTIKFKIKIYTHDSFEPDVTISNFKLNNKLNIITNDGKNLLLDVMAYDSPNYSTISQIMLGDEQTSYSENYSASDFLSKKIGSYGQIYDNPDYVWESFTGPSSSTYGACAALDTNNNKIYVFGGDSSTNSAKVYDISSDLWTTLTSAPEDIVGGTAQYYDGSIYICITDPSDSTKSKIYEYSISGDNYTLKKSNIAASHKYGDSIIYNKKMYIMSGTSDGVNNIIVYDIDADTVSTSEVSDYSATTYDLEGGRCAYYNKKIYVFGGKDLPDSTLIYDIVNDTWSSGTDMPIENMYFGCVSTRNKLVTGQDIIYIINGKNNTYAALDSVYAYDIATDSWIAKSDTNFSNAKMATVTDGFYIYNIGGIGADMDTALWRYEPEPLSCVIGGYAYGNVTYGNTVYKDTYSRYKLGTCRLGDVSVSDLYTTYHKSTSRIADTNIRQYAWIKNDGNSDVTINSIGFFTGDDSPILFGYSKLKFTFNTEDYYRVAVLYKIVDKTTAPHVTLMENAYDGFLSRLFFNEYAYPINQSGDPIRGTYVNLFLAGENSDYFDSSDNSMDSEHVGPTSFNSVSIDTSEHSILFRGELDTSTGNGHTFNAFASLLEGADTQTIYNPDSFTNATGPFAQGDGNAATLTYSSTDLNVSLGNQYSNEISINGVYIDLDISGTSTTNGIIKIITYDGSSWSEEITLVDGFSGSQTFRGVVQLDVDVYGIGIKFENIKGDISVNSIRHAGDERQFFYGTKINNDIDKTSDYDILTDMKVKIV